MITKLAYPYTPFLEEGEPGQMYVTRYQKYHGGPQEWWCIQTGQWTPTRPEPMSLNQATLRLRDRLREIVRELTTQIRRDAAPFTPSPPPAPVTDARSAQLDLAKVIEECRARNFHNMQQHGKRLMDENAPDTLEYALGRMIAADVEELVAMRRGLAQTDIGDDELPVVVLRD